mgnify:CR=1 FL=1
MYKASYYLNIIAKNSYREWSNVIYILKARAKEQNPHLLYDNCLLLILKNIYY